MKKFFLLVLTTVCCYTQMNAEISMANIEETSYDSVQCREENRNRQDTVLYIENYPSDLTLCLGTPSPTVTVWGLDGCEDFCWYINGNPSGGNSITIDPQESHYFFIVYQTWESCDNFGHSFSITYKENAVPNSYEQYVWLPEGEPFDLQLVEADSLGTNFGYTFQWEGGLSTNGYAPSVPGDYTGFVNHICGTATRIFHCRWYPKLKSASYDPTSEDGLAVNVTWESNEHITPYVGSVNLIRDGYTISPVNYSTDTLYVDNVSLQAMREYQLQIVDASGAVCPELSQPITTLFVMHVMGIDGVYMTWNPLIGYGEIENFFVGEFIPSKDGEVHIIDTLGHGAQSALCPYAMFDNGAYGLILAKTSGRAEPIMIQSNRTTQTTDGIGENGNSQSLSIYPNPAKGQFTINCNDNEEINIIIVNTIGQVILHQKLKGQKTLSLPPGEYYLNVVDRNNALETTKLIVE